MRTRMMLKLIMVMSLAGTLFSGYLSFTEIFQKTCALGTCSTQVAGVPSCVYGFAMFFMVLILSIIGLSNTKSKIPPFRCGTCGK